MWMDKKGSKEQWRGTQWDGSQEVGESAQVSMASQRQQDEPKGARGSLHWRLKAQFKIEAIIIAGEEQVPFLFSLVLSSKIMTKSSRREQERILGFSSTSFTINKPRVINRSSLISVVEEAV